MNVMALNLKGGTIVGFEAIARGFEGVSMVIGWVGCHPAHWGSKRVDREG